MSAITITNRARVIMNGEPDQRVVGVNTALMRDSASSSIGTCGGFSESAYDLIVDASGESDRIYGDSYTEYAALHKG
jgi:hypothetical protein